MIALLAAAPVPCAVFAVCAIALTLGLIAEYTNIGEYFARFLGLPHELEQR